MPTQRIAGATLNQTPIQWETNFQNILTAIRQAQNEKIAILCLPELCITGYGCEDLFLSRWIYEKALDYLLKIKPFCQNIVVAIGLPMRFNNQSYNCACVIANGEIVGITAKQFLALDGVHYEPRWFKAWQSEEVDFMDIEGKQYPFGDILYDLNGVKFGIEICEDAWHGEARPGFRHCRKGAQLILGLNASHFAFGKLHTRYNLVQELTRQTGCTYVYANLLGNEAGKMIYGGDIIIAQAERILQSNERLSFQDTNLAIADIDFEQPAHSTTPKPYLPDQEDDKVDFTKAVALALFDYLRKSRSKGFVLSLSGGADSSTCAVLVAEMVRRGERELGLEVFLSKLNIFDEAENQLIIHRETNPTAHIMNRLLCCVYQAADSSSQATLDSARVLADSIFAEFHVWSISEEVGSYRAKIEEALSRQLTWEQDDIALQNIQARARSPIIWMMANIKNSLLLTTSNRSEGSVGYATMDGDTSGSISPIAGVDKHFIRQWLLWAEQHLDYQGLKPVNNLQPSAELRPQEKAQTDETDLMPYHVLQAIEELAIRNYQSPKQVFETLKYQNLEPEDLLKAHIKKFYTLWSRSQWKRERLAPSFHLDDYNVDPRSWCRFPILSGGFVQELAAL